VRERFFEERGRSKWMKKLQSEGLHDLYWALNGGRR